jgi:hypothetical protein
MHLKLLEKQEQTKPQTIRWREITKIRDEMKTKQTTQRINETQSWFFEKISKTDKLLANITKWRREKTHINKIKDEKESLENTLKIYIQVNWKN